MSKELEKATAKKLITDAARDYLTAKITLPLGNPALKHVHTNQFLFTALPKDFPLKHWETIANSLNSGDTRFANYQVNRWYVEGTQIDVDVSGKAEMQIDLNAFASSTSKYSESRRSYEKAYTDAFNKNANNNTTNKNSSNKKTSNATKKNNTALFSSKAGRNVGGDLTTALKKIIKDCNTEEQKAYCIYDWVDRYVTYKFYWDSRYSSSQVLTGHIANCWDTAFLIYNLCTKAKVRCEVYNGYYHFLDGTYGHLWNKIPYKGKMTFADTGRSGRNPIGNHGSGRYIVSGGGSPYRKNY